MKSLWFQIYLQLIVILYQRTQAIPGFDRGLIECEEHFATYLLHQILSGLLMEVNEFDTCSWFPNVHISCYCAEWNQEKSTEYMEEQILDSLSARMRQQPEDEDHLCCSPTEPLH